jgi:ferri-bacillibactin esterase
VPGEAHLGGGIVAVETRKKRFLEASMDGYETFDLPAEHIDQTFRIHVALPAAYGQNPSATFPIAYVLDADLLFGTAATTMKMCATDQIDPSVAPAIIVGIGYTDPEQMSILRVRDLTPENSVDDWFAELHVQTAGRKAEGGGAAAFLSFIEQELDPQIHERYRSEEETATIFGDSYGGLFAYYAFLQRSRLFDRFWIGSPGVLGCGGYLFDELPPVLERGFERPTRVFLSLGELERTGSVHGSLPVEIYQEIATAYDRLRVDFTRREITNLTVEAKEFEGETHSSVVPAALNRAYRFLLRRE